MHETMIGNETMWSSNLLLDNNLLDVDDDPKNSNSSNDAPINETIDTPIRDDTCDVIDVIDGVDRIDRISTALRKNGAPHENVALYGNRASDQIWVTLQRKPLKMQFFIRGKPCLQIRRSIKIELLYKAWFTPRGKDLWRSIRMELHFKRQLLPLRQPMHKKWHPLIHFGKNFSHQKKSSFPEKRPVPKIHKPSLRWNKMNQNGKKVLLRTNGRYENVETLNFSEKGEVICKQCNKLKRTVANVDSKSPQLSRIVHYGEVKVLYQAKSMRHYASSLKE
ncbi:hypothetical protein ACH5RR_008386 [Cinchona calisaya]|uniref:Uncharacterized protein n=1 Tax=Cinchona calisaya TaxID=153742 RepID=A0ABD3ABF5_9GENT